MDTSRCKAFIASASTGSFTKAAEELNYTTSGVSQLVSSLEEDLGLTLLVRNRKGVSLTADGKRMYNSIYNFLKQEERIYQNASEITGLLVGEISIAAYPSICALWLPGIISDFRRKNPGVTFSIDDSIRRYVVEALSNGRADVGFMSNLHDFSGEWIDLQMNPMVVLVSKSSPYSQWSSFPIEYLGKVPIIQQAFGHDPDVNQIFEKNHIRPNIAYTTRNSSTAAAMVQHNMGIMLVNELSTKMWNFDVKTLILDPPQYVSMGMVVPANNTASPAVREFVRFVRESFKAPLFLSDNNADE